MAKLVDPDDLTQGSEITITPGTSGTITLNPGSGNLIYADGVTGQCVYSFLKEEWRTDSNLIKFPFPMVAITEEQFELIDSWNWADQTTKNTIRDAGWALKNTAGVSREEYMNLTTLGSFLDSGTDTAYYVQTTPTSGGTPTDTVFPGEVNQAIKIFGNTNYGNFDYRDNFVIWLREEAKTYDQYDLLTEQNLTALTYKKYALPLSNASDAVKVTHTDAQIASGADYQNVIVSYYTTAQARTIGSSSYNFHVIIDADGQLAEIVYEKIQYLLRQTSNINSNPATSAGYPVRGDIADELLAFIGDTLRTKYVAGWGGTFIDNYNTQDINRLEFIDDTNPSTPVTFPFTATGTLDFNDNLVNDADALYWMFFTSIGASAYGTTDAILVEDTDSNTITGEASASSIAWTFDYDGNVQGGRTPGTDAAVTVVAIGLNTAQYVRTTSTISRATGQSISLVAALERNYSNP
jgi:hypothetical protein